MAIKKTRGTLIPITIFASTFLFLQNAFSQDEIQYKKFNLDTAICNVAVMYKRTPETMDVGVSAIATGMGAEFKKWNVTDMNLSIGGGKIKPERSGKFYAKEKSFFRVPAAVLFAALGTQVKTTGSDLEQGIAKAGVAAGLGLLVLQAHGEITGARCIFRLNRETVDKITKPKDAIEIMVENEEMHAKYKIKIGIAGLPLKAKPRFEYDKMSQEELLNLVAVLEGQVKILEKNQASYKYGSDPEYDEIQRKIERLETERGMAYNVWFEREQEKGK